MYKALAEVYDFLVPEALLTPEGSAAAFEVVIAELEPGARVLDCACGTGTLAAGLALRGFDVSASDASPEMVARALAARSACAPRCGAWEELDGGPFDAVLCVGNSITHAQDRRAALAGMRGVAARRRAARRHLAQLGAAAGGGEEVVERGGRRARCGGVGWLRHPPAFEIEVTLDGRGPRRAADLLAVHPRRARRRPARGRLDAGDEHVVAGRGPLPGHRSRSRGE